MKPITYFLLPCLFLTACSGLGKQEIIGTNPEEVSRLWIDLFNKEDFEQLKIISGGQALTLVNEVSDLFGEFPINDDEEPLPPVLVASMDCEQAQEDKATCVYCCNEGKNETLLLIKENEQWKVTEIISELDDEGGMDDILIDDMLDNMLENTDTLNSYQSTDSNEK